MDVCDYLMVGEKRYNRAVSDMRSLICVQLEICMNILVVYRNTYKIILYRMSRQSRVHSPAQLYSFGQTGEGDLFDCARQC